MLRKSKRNPESITAGRNVTSRAIWLATNWLFTADEIQSPMASATSR